MAEKLFFKQTFIRDINFTSLTIKPNIVRKLNSSRTPHSQLIWFALHGTGNSNLLSVIWNRVEFGLSKTDIIQETDSNSNFICNRNQCYYYY